MKKEKIDSLYSSLTKEYDVFICCSSFESRCLSIPKVLSQRKFYKTIIVENKNGSEKIHNNTHILVSLFEKKSNVVLSVDFDDPIMVADRFLNEVKRVPSGRKTSILVDITTFTHETLMIMYKVLSIKKRFINATFIYLNALDYSPNNEIRHKWLSQGCREVHSILGYPGLLIPSQKNRLIIITGYEYNRVADIIYSIEPHNLTLVYSSKKHATTEMHKEANEYYLEFLQKMKFDFDKIDSQMIPCDDPIRVCGVLSSLYEKYKDENIIVIPMNNKISTVGVAMSLTLNEGVQACYAPAVVYNEDDYSLPGKTCFIFPMYCSDGISDVSTNEK